MSEDDDDFISRESFYVKLNGSEHFQIPEHKAQAYRTANVADVQKIFLKYPTKR